MKLYQFVFWNVNRLNLYYIHLYWNQKICKHFTGFDILIQIECDYCGSFMSSIGVFKHNILSPDERVYKYRSKILLSKPKDFSILHGMDGMREMMTQILKRLEKTIFRNEMIENMVEHCLGLMQIFPICMNEE